MTTAQELPIDGATADHSARGDVVPVLLLAALAAVLALIRLDHKALWADEVGTLAYARLPWSDFWDLATDEVANMGAYYVALRGWVEVVGHSVFAARALSVVAAAVALPLVFLVGRRLVGRNAALVGAVLVGVNAFFVKYAQELRGYSLVLLLSCASTLAFARLVERPTRGLAVMYALAVTASLYVHFLSAFVVVAHLVSLAYLPPDRRPWRLLGLGALVTAVAASPLALFILTSERNNIDWVEPFGAHQVRKLAFDLTSAGAERRPSDLLSLALVALYAGAIIVALVGAWHVWRGGRSEAAWRWALVVSWAAVPVVLGICVSVVEPVLVPRYFIGTLPAIGLLAGAGLVRMAPTWRLAVSLALVACCGLALVRWYDAPSFESWDDAADRIATRAEPGDVVVVYPGALNTSFAYYSRALDASPPMVYPTTDAFHFPDEVPQDPIDALEDASATRVWLVTHTDSQDEVPAVHRLLEEHDFREQDEWEGRRVVVELFER